MTASRSISNKGVIRMIPAHIRKRFIGLLSLFFGAKVTIFHALFIILTHFSLLLQQK